MKALFADDHRFYFEKVIALNSSELFTLIKSNFGDISEEIRFKEKLLNCDYFLLDDMGSSHNTDWQISWILEILDYRYTHFLPTIVNTNFTFTEIEEKMDGRIESRLSAQQNLILENWDDDLRKKRE